MMAIVVVLTAWTLAVVATPALRFDALLPEARVPLETAGGVVAALTAALAYLHFSLDRSRAFLFVALAFVAIATNRLVYAALSWSSHFSGEEAAYQWMVGRLFLAALLLVGATRWHRLSRGHTPSRVFLFHAAAVVAMLAAAQWILSTFRSSLPALADTSMSTELVTGPLPGLTPVDIALGLIGASSFLLAGVLYLRAPVTGFVSTWLPPALVVAAFSHVHFMLVPTVFTDRISSGDVLRLMFSSVLLIGLMIEVGRTYAKERDRATELAAAYESEAARVRHLEESDRAKVQMFKILTHELLHPVAAVRSTTLAVMRRWEDLDDRRKRELIGRIEAQTLNLMELAQDVPRVMIDGERFPLSRTERTVASLVDDVRRLAEAHYNLVDEVPDEVRTEHVLIDPIRMLQVFHNLLSNAEKFSAAGAPVTMAASVADDDVVFRIEDRGRGIVPEERRRIFEVGGRGRGAQGVPGAGLGLYVVQGIVEAHGGRIWVEERPDGGSVFLFTIRREMAQ